MADTTSSKLKLTIGIKFIVSVFITFTCITAISYFTIIQVLQYSLRNEIQANALRSANIIANLCTDNLDKGTITKRKLKFLDNYLDMLQKELKHGGDVAYVAVLGKNKEVIIHSREIPQFKQNILNLNFPIKYKKNTIGWIRITYTLEYILKKFFNQGKDIFLVVMAGTMAVLVVVIYLLTYLIIFRNINKIRTGIKKIIEGNYSMHLNINSRDELGELASNFNLMAEKLNDSHTLLESRIKSRTQELLEANDRLDNIFKNISDTLIVLNSSGEIIDLNSSAISLLGYDKEELLNKNVSIVCKDLRLAETTFLQNRRVIQFDSTYTTKNNTQIPMVMSVSSLKDDSDNVTGYLITGKDYREIERLQSRIIESEKLASIGQLTAGIAHEIRNLLTIINTTVYYLKSKINIEADEGLRSNFEHLADTVEREEKLINDLLQFSKPVKLNLKTLDIESMLNETTSLINQKLKEQNVSMTMNTGTKLPNIIGDEAHLQEVLLNILLNALDVLPNSGGTIEMKACLKDKDIEKDLPIDPSFYIPVCMEISISNNGRQIPAELLNKIFDPFFTTKESSKRTGLGLSICYNIIRSHKGKIYAVSEPGQTSFIINLPIEKRKFARFQVNESIKIKAVDKQFTATLKNIGEGGICICSDQPLDENAFVDITPAGSSEKEMPVKAKVVWSSRNKQNNDFYDSGLQIETKELPENSYFKTLSEKVAKNGQKENPGS